MLLPAITFITLSNFLLLFFIVRLFLPNSQWTRTRTRPRPRHRPRPRPRPTMLMMIWQEMRSTTTMLRRSSNSNWTRLYLRVKMIVLPLVLNLIRITSHHNQKPHSHMINMMSMAETWMTALNPTKTCTMKPIR